MSDVNETMLAWRQLLKQTGVSEDDATELESHLIEQMDALQKAGLRPDESFVIASRRLGHPHELAVEYSKNDVLMSWKRPARLVLWGLLMLDVTSFIFSAMLLVVFLAGLWNDFGSTWLGNLFWLSHLSNWAALGLLWSLAANSQGTVGRILARLEAWLQTGRGAALLISGAATLQLVNVSIRFWIEWLLTPDHANPPSQIDFFTFNMFTQLLVVQLAWTIPVVLLLVILVRVERTTPIAKLATR